MTHYRMYWIDEYGQVAARSPLFAASNDEDAQQYAQAESAGDYLEVWQRSRLVASINPRPMSDLRPTREFTPVG